MTRGPTSVAPPARPLLALLVLLVAAGAAAQDYFPTEPGTSWTYSNGETQTLTGPRDVLGGPKMVLIHYYEGAPVSEEYLEYGEGGVVSHGTAAGGAVMRYMPPLTVYPPPPLHAGDTWQSTTTVAGVDITLSSEVLGTVGVQTPAGRFNALRIRQTTLTSSGGRTVLELYFVPSVGVVRFLTQDGTAIDLIEHSF